MQKKNIAKLSNLSKLVSFCMENVHFKQIASI